MTVGELKDKHRDCLMIDNYLELTMHVNTSIEFAISILENIPIDSTQPGYDYVQNKIQELKNYLDETND